MRTGAYGHSEEKWNLMLQQIKKTGKRKLFIRKAGAFASLLLVVLGIWFFSKEPGSSTRYMNRLTVNEAEISVAVVQNHVYYDEDFGFIGQ